jgi:hypothetical protein
MFRENRSHEQPGLFSSVSTMAEPVRARLEQSWAKVFFEYCFSQIDESIFAVLYSDTPSRPNVAVNVLIGLEILKSGLGWSDEELFDAFLYDMQVRYALGYDDLNQGYFALRTLYNFRQRLSQYQQEQGINLLHVAFEGFTDEQVKRLQVRTTKLRMDSTQIASDICDASRLYLLVEGIRRLWRILDGEEQGRYGVLCEPYVRREADHYVYRVKGKAATDAAVTAIGLVLAQLLDELQDRYVEHGVYQTVQRLFADNYRLEADGVVTKANDEIGSGALQSLDDLEATFRCKEGECFKGYAANLTETCNEENAVQLIVQVQVESNNTDDSRLLVDAVPSLVERTDVETLYTDGGYGSSAGDVILNAHQVTQIQTGIRGNAPDPTKLALADFVIAQDEQGTPTHLTCPQGQRGVVSPGRSTGFLAHFAPEVCAQCPLQRAAMCRAKPRQRDPRFTLSFTQEEVFRAQRRRRYRAFLTSATNLRAAVEATVRSVKHPFRNGKVPVRGHFRVTCMVVASAAMCNVRRIHRYLAQTGDAGPVAPACRHLNPLSAPLRRLALLSRFHQSITDRFTLQHLCRSRNLCFGC